MEGNVSIIELKRNKTPRDVVAQALDYASYIQKLTIAEIKDIFRIQNPEIEIEQAFSDKFSADLPESINENHNMVIVSSELDSSTERILVYLSENFGVPINVVFFRFFIDGENRYLTRTWLVDPNIVEQQTKKSRTREAWNQRDFYISFGASEHRSWKDAIKYGFISAGQGDWYSRTLKQLFISARVFVYIPQEGYVGVGIVEDTSKPVVDFFIEENGSKVPILDANLDAPMMDENSTNPELSEYLVKIRWIKTVPREQAYKETGMFANQNTVCKLRNKFTLEKLYAFFDLDE